MPELESFSVTLCPSGQGDGLEIHWALPAGVRIPSLSFAAGALLGGLARAQLQEHMAAVAQLAARRSHNPKVVNSILTCRIFLANICS